MDNFESIISLLKATMHVFPTGACITGSLPLERFIHDSLNDPHHQQNTDALRQLLERRSIGRFYEGGPIDVAIYISCGYWRRMIGNADSRRPKIQDARLLEMPLQAFATTTTTTTTSTDVSLF